MSIHMKIGSRKSQLALAQSDLVAKKIQEIFPDVTYEIIKISTTGDRLYNENLALIGGKGLFLKEIEDKLLKGTIDIAVHSMKDVPAILPSGLHIGAILEREDTRDVLISPKYKKLDSLPQNATIGSCSARRKQYLKVIRPDIEVVHFRGNVNTRLKKVYDGEVDGCVLAYSGLKRLGMCNEITDVFSCEEMLPAIGQGAIGVESQKDNPVINNILKEINHHDSFIAVEAEREILKGLDADCSDAIAAHAYMEGGNIYMNAAFIPKNQDSYIEVQGMKYLIK